jgi:peptide deformylase
MKEIVQQTHKVLRETAKEVPVDQINSTLIQGILADMHESLSGESDGVALAAPQIAVPLRIFVISPIAYDTINSQTGSDQDNKTQTADRKMVFINPTIIKKSKDNKTMDEGCLSVRPWYGKVKRASRATVEAYDENGEKFQMEGSGLIAQIFQHEIDHLDGILFIDKAKDLRKIVFEDEDYD